MNSGAGISNSIRLDAGTLRWLIVDCIELGQYGAWEAAVERLRRAVPWALDDAGMYGELGAAFAFLGAWRDAADAYSRAAEPCQPSGAFQTGGE